MPRASLSRDLKLIDLAGCLRSFGTGFLGVVLGVYLYRAGFSSIQLGLVLAAGLAGIGAATFLLSFRADRWGRRRVLIALSLLTAVGGAALIFGKSPAILLPLAFLGMLNGTGTDRSAAFALEQATIPALIPDNRRTWALAWYNMLLDGGGAVGALLAGLPLLIAHWAGTSLLAAYKLIFIGFAALNLLTAIVYSLLSDQVELIGEGLPGQVPVSPETKRVVTKLISLFSIDAFGGGLLTDAVVSYWFFRRFDIAEQGLGLLFFAIRVLNAGSHLGAAWLAKRIGLLNTMVFTHLPSSIFLIAVPFAPKFKIAAAFLLARESLVEMDVPTRQSYLAAVVRPHERTYASGVTNLSRTISWAAASSITGVLMQNVAFSTPLLLGGGLKIVYDILLYRGFKHLRPPEEAVSAAQPQFTTGVQRDVTRKGS